MENTFSNINKTPAQQYISAVNRMRKLDLDVGPCHISHERYAQLDKLKYERDLNHTEKQEYLAFRFYQSFGYNIDFSRPVTFNEKLNWLKIFYHNPLQTICADKAKFKIFVEKRLPQSVGHCVKPVALFSSISDMNSESYSRLPNNFFIKSNFGSGAQAMIKKSETSIETLKKIILCWLNPRSNHYYFALENCYKDIEPAVVCEPVLEFEYKIEFFCFSGEPFIYWIVMNDKSADMGINIYSMSGERLPVRRKKYPNFRSDPKPPYFMELVSAARALSSGFPHVRVDFYAAKDTWHFSEMTFFTGAGLIPFNKYEYDILLGKKIDLEMCSGKTEN